MYLLYVMMMKFLIHENFADDYVMIMNMIICNIHNMSHKDTDASINEKGQKIGWIVIVVTHD